MPARFDQAVLSARANLFGRVVSVTLRVAATVGTVKILDADLSPTGQYRCPCRDLTLTGQYGMTVGT